MKKFLLYVFFSFLTILPTLAEPLQGNISMIDNLPDGIYGSWKVASIQIYSNNPNISAPIGIDYWNIYRNNSVLTLENPTTNAKASVTVDAVKNNSVTFTRTSKKENEETIETPTITIVDNDFFGTDTMIIKKYENGVLTKTDVVKFQIRGTKTGGQTTNKLLN